MSKHITQWNPKGWERGYVTQMTCSSLLKLSPWQGASCKFMQTYGPLLCVTGSTRARSFGRHSAASEWLSRNQAQGFQEISRGEKSKYRFCMLCVKWWQRWKDCCSSSGFDAKNCNRAYQPCHRMLSIILFLEYFVKRSSHFFVSLSMQCMQDEVHLG